MDLDLTQEQQLVRETVRDFALERVAPVAEELDRESRFPYELVAELAELGLMGLPVPEEYGGAGGDTISYALAIEELTRIDSSVAITVAAHTSLGTMPILLFGTEEQKQRWLPDLASGRKLAAFGLTEPGAGSDAGATRTKAELVDGHWRVNGAKQFITNSGSDITSLVTVTARTGTREGGKAEVSTIIVPSGTPGFTAEPAYDKLGWHASDTHPLTFTDVEVPGANLLGERGRGFAQFLATLDDGRVAIAALAVGCIQACLDMSVAYAGERTTFGVPIGSKQGVAFQVADLEVMLEASRMLTYKAAAMKDAGRPMREFKQAAAIAKLYATESAVTATRIATQVFGGYGVMEEYPVTRFYRDAKVLEIGEGTSEVQRMLIARGRGLPVE
jgi:short-chain 2-methylacyl-CoA dehydrogenase